MLKIVFHLFIFFKAKSPIFGLILLKYSYLFTQDARVIQYEEADNDDYDASYYYYYDNNTDSDNM